MAGLLPEGHDRAALRDTYVEQPRLGGRAGRAASTFLIEPINTRDIPGFFLNRQDHAHEIVQLVDAPNLKVQMDLYHCQIVEGDLAMKLKQYLPTGRVGHLQIAGVPERHEPDVGEVNYPYLFALIDSLGYAGVHRRRVPAARRHLGRPRLVPALQEGSIDDETAHHRRRRLRRRAPGAHAARARHAGRRDDRPDRAGRPVRAAGRPAGRCARRARAPARCCRRRAALADEGFDGVFHLASAVSGECEADFDLGLRSNLDSTRALLDGFRLQRGGKAPRFVFSSSVAVFGPDPAVPLPAVVADTTLPAPQTSYGTQKLICEHLVADYTRKGYIDGRGARLMTVTVRPGQPNGAASSFFSGIIREPLAGVEVDLPGVARGVAPGVVAGAHGRRR